MKKPMRGLWPMFQFLHKPEMKMLKSGIAGLSAWGLNSNPRQVPTKPPVLLSLALAPLLSLPLTLPSLSLPIHTNHSSQLPSAISTSQNTLCVINATPADQLVPFQRLIPSKSEMGEATQNTESSSSVQKNV